MPYQLVFRADAGEHQELRGVESAAGEDHLAGRTGRPFLAGLLARVAMRPVQALALEILDPDRSLLLVEKHPGRECVELDRQIAGIPLLGAEQKLPCAVPAAPKRGERRQAKPDRIVADEPPVVGIEPTEQEPPDPLEVQIRAQRRGLHRPDDDLDEVLVLLQGLDGYRDLGREPAVVAVARRVPELVDPAPRKPAVVAVLHALIVLAHVLRTPRGIAGELREVVPVAVVRVDRDHRVVRRTAAQGAGPRVEHAVHALAVPGFPVFRIALLLRRVGVMAHPEIPAQRVALGGNTVKGGHVVVVRQVLSVRVPAHPAGRLARITARFEQQDFPSGRGEPRGDGPAPRTRANHDVLEIALYVGSGTHGSPSCTCFFTAYGAARSRAGPYGHVAARLLQVERSRCPASMQGEPIMASKRRSSVSRSRRLTSRPMFIWINVNCSRSRS